MSNDIQAARKFTEEELELKKRFYDYFEMRTKNFLGRVLTQIDASVAEERQNKALKDLIKSQCHDFMCDIQGYASNQPGELRPWGHSINLQ